MEIATSEHPEFKKVTIPFTQEYHNKARRIAIMERRTPGKLMTFLLEQAIDSYLNDKANSDLKERRN